MFTVKNLSFELKDLIITVSGSFSPFSDEFDCTENSMVLQPIDEDYIVLYEIMDETDDLKKSLNEYQKNTYNYEHCSDIEEIEINGIKGYCYTYSGNVNQCFEIRLPAHKTKDGFLPLAFTVLTKNGKIETIKNKTEVKALLNGIRKKDR